jgi:hypothetical protein
MHFLDDSLLPENQQKLVIQVAPYGPQWLPEDFPEDIPVSMADQVQKAVDCYNAGATVLHLHCREADGQGSKRLSMFNEMIDRVRSACPDMLIQVGGSISFAPEGEGSQAKWLSDDTRHMLADLTPKPDQVTIAINTNQMNITELMSADDIAGTDLPPSEWPNFYFRIGHEGGMEWRGSTSRKRSSASCVKRRSCWRRAGRWQMHAGGSALRSRATTAGARNMAV